MTPTDVFIPRGLYAVTPENLAGGPLQVAVGAALDGGAVLVQYRAKARAEVETARALAGLCRERGVGLIVNDDPDLAAAAGADGVHLGRDDPDIDRARARLGEAAIIGVSCYDDLKRAAVMAEAGADYLAFGSVRPSPTKPDAVTCPPETLAAARELGRPVVAIGGITVENAGAVAAAGADLVAVISDLFGARDITARARRYAQLFTRNQ